MKILLVLVVMLPFYLAQVLEINSLSELGWVIDLVIRSVLGLLARPQPDLLREIC